MLVGNGRLQSRACNKIAPRMDTHELSRARGKGFRVIGRGDLDGTSAERSSRERDGSSRMNEEVKERNKQLADGRYCSSFWKANSVVPLQPSANDYFYDVE